MRRPRQSRWVPPTSERPARTPLQRDRLAVLFAIATIVCLGLAFLLAKGRTFLMPGPLASAHGAIENCSACHTRSGGGKLSWLHGLVAGDPLADSKACLTCHKMPDTAFNAHGASADALKKSTERLARIAALPPAPHSARAQNVAFPTDGMVARGLYCATCHQEHQGDGTKLNKITNEQCQSCHVVKFDSFDGHHPEFESYPFERRTRIIYDHAGHFGKHFPEVAKKDPARRIPATCSACHESRGESRIMAVAPFEQTCSACHRDQISGKERVSGPKGIAFLALPGLDLPSLKQKKAAIGEWPDHSEAPLTPFMKMMIGRKQQGRALIETVDRLDLQDLSKASDVQIKAVADLAWEIKSLYFSLIWGKASDVFDDLEIGDGRKPSAALVSDLTASIPRDVLIAAQQRWLPNLAAEIARGPAAVDRQQDGWSTSIAETPTASAKDDSAQPPPEQTSVSSVREEAESGPSASVSEDDTAAKRDPQPCVVRVLGQCLLFKAPEQGADRDQSEASAGGTDTAVAKPTTGKTAPVARELPAALRAGLKDVAATPQAEEKLGKAIAAKAEPKGTVVAAGASKAGAETPAAGQRPRGKAPDQSDDLLVLTEEEQRAMKSRGLNASRSAPPEQAPAGAAAGSVAAPADPKARAAPAMTLDSNVDPESWAEHGGWYQQDHAIFYRPVGHKDKFITSWLILTGAPAAKGAASPTAAVFDYLTRKDAQGSCTKCHSVDEIQGKGRTVNFAALSAAMKKARLTRFNHEPHFGSVRDRGCLTCHNLEKGRPYLKSYENHNPYNFASEFGAVKKQTCRACHTKGMASQDCLSCHKYHVNDAITPITNTKLPP